MHQSNILMNVSVGNVLVTNQSNVVKFSELKDPYPVYVLAIITAIYLAIFVIGLVGNVTACIVIVSNKSMHTVTNCYLFNLAMSDLLLLLSGLPYDVIISWDPYKYDFGNVGCFLRAWTAETSTNVSILTTTAFTFERYLAVCRPITAQVMSKLSRAIKLIIAIWIVSILCAAIVAYQSEDLIADDEYRCSFNLTIPYSLDIMALLFFVVPLAVITILYILIGKNLQSSEKMKVCRNNNSDKYSKNILKMLVVIVVVFFISWAPFQAQRMLFVHQFEIESNGLMSYDVLLKIADGLYFISGVFYFFSAAMNPIIYNIMSKKFRDAFKETIAKRCYSEKEESLSSKQINQPIIVVTSDQLF